MASGKSRNGTRAATPALEIPDVIGDAGRAKVLAQQFEAMQTQRFHVETAMIANGESESDICRGAWKANGTAMTYGERLEQLRAAEQRLAEWGAEYMPEVNRLLAEMRGD